MSKQKCAAVHIVFKPLNRVDCAWTSVSGTVFCIMEDGIWLTNALICAGLKYAKGCSDALNTKPETQYRR